jgi:hypothetical protein
MIDLLISADADAQWWPQLVTERHPGVGDEVNSDYSINGACQSQGP